MFEQHFVVINDVFNYKAFQRPSIFLLTRLDYKQNAVEELARKQSFDFTSLEHE